MTTSPGVRRSLAALVCVLPILSPLAPASAAPRSAAISADSSAAPQTPKSASALAALPMGFEPNVGQCDAGAAFLARGRGYGVFLSRDSVVLGVGQQGDALRMRLVGANAEARLTPERELPGVSNYLVGSDPEKWHRDVPTYAAVRYTGLYDGVDMVCYGNGQRLEYDLEVAPGADPSRVRLRFEGQRTATVDDDGDLVLGLAGGEIRQQRALVYQGDGASKRPVAARYVLGAGGEVGLDVGDYDRTRPLVVDPVLVFADFLGAGASNDSAADVAVDASGNAYVLGTTDATDFPTTPGAYDTTLGPETAAGPSDLFVTKLNATGTSLLYSTYLGGSGTEGAGGIAVDSAGHAFVAGATYANDFPTTPGAYDTSPTFGDAVVVELTPTGTGLVYSTALGGSSNDAALGIAVDASGRATVVGQTISTDFPTTAGAYDTALASGYLDVFVTRLNAGGATLSYSTYLGGALDDVPSSVALDASGAAIVTGLTGSSDFPTTNGVAIGGSYDAFVTKVAPSGATLAYSRFLGGEGEDRGWSVAVDGSGAAYVAGATHSAQFPTTQGALQTAPDTQNGSVFVTKLSPAGATVYSSRFGGSGYDTADDVAVDSAGNAYVACTTASADFPVVLLSYDTSYNGGYDAVVVKLNSVGSSLTYGTFVGGGAGEYGTHLALTPSNAVVIVGTTQSVDFPTTAGAVRARSAAGNDAFVAEIAANGRSLVYGSYLSGTASHTQTVEDSASGVAVDGSGSAYVVGSTASGNFPTTAGSYDPNPNPVESAGGSFAYVSKLSADGSSLVYSTFLDGTSFDIAYAVSVDATGAATVVGTTGSADFPITPGAADSVYTNDPGLVAGEGFVTKLTPAGNALDYSTFLGGDAWEEIHGIALGPGGVAYVTGITASTNFPTTSGAYDRTLGGAQDAFVTAVAADGRSFAYSTYLGGTGDDVGLAVAVDGSGSAYATGAAKVGFPTTPGAFDTSFAGEATDDTDTFVAKLAPNGGSLVYSTYLGGELQDVGSSVAVDAAGDAFVAGFTYSNDFPTTPGAYQSTLRGFEDAFVTKVAPDGGALVFSTYLGGENGESATAVMLDASGDAIVAGGTGSTMFPTTPGAYDTTLGPHNAFFNSDAFVTVFTASGSGLVYSTFLGGNDLEECNGAAVDPNGAVVVAGRTWSTNFATAGFGSRDGSSAFVAKLDIPAGFRGDTPGVYSPSTGAWFLRNSNSPGAADSVFTFGAGGAGFLPISGDWNGDGVDSPGLYAPSTGTFFLKNSSGPGPADLAFAFGPGGPGVLPLVGDWNGDGSDSVGIYVVASGTFFLRNADSPGPADLAFQFGGGGAGVAPLAGDWNGDGTDTVGLYVPATGVFFLRDANSPGPADATFAFGPPNLTPLVGDWNGDGTDTIGVYASASGTWFLKNANASGAADRAFAYGPPGATPVAGDWDGH